MKCCSKLRDSQVQLYTYKHIYDTYVMSDE